MRGAGRSPISQCGVVLADRGAKARLVSTCEDRLQERNQQIGAQDRAGSEGGDSKLNIRLPEATAGSLRTCFVSEVRLGHIYDRVDHEGDQRREVGCQAGPECNCVIEIATWTPDLEDQVLGQPVRQADFLKPGCQPNGCWAQIGLEFSRKPSFGGSRTPPFATRTTM